MHTLKETEVYIKKTSRWFPVEIELE